MAVLKKIKASTLMETLVATVLIVILFMVSSMILNNLFSNSIKNNTRAIEAQLNELEYLYHNNQIKLPYDTDYNNWSISVDTFKENNTIITEFEAVNKTTLKLINRQRIENK